QSGPSAAQLCWAGVARSASAGSVVSKSGDLFSKQQFSRRIETQIDTLSQMPEYMVAMPSNDTAQPGE
ncbi:MAG: hypothetical protein JXA33_23715, partial [Anaerolineae bacterium]|nr:hypothetical protein [Anaerolineae bacterium]